MNNRNTTPKAATRSIASTLVSASASSHGARAARRPRPDGPKRDSGKQEAEHRAMRRRKNSGATIPAVTRKISVSL